MIPMDVRPSVCEELRKIWSKKPRGQIPWISRFRDDIIGLFRGNQQQFEEFKRVMCEVDEEIKFTGDIDVENKGVVYLDLVISLDTEGFIQTTLHRKPNTVNQLLLPSSAHPPHVTRSTVYSLGLRVKRN